MHNELDDHSVNEDNEEYVRPTIIWNDKFPFQTDLDVSVLREDKIRAADIIHRYIWIRICREVSARQGRRGTGGAALGTAELDAPLIDGVLQAASCRQGSEHDVTNE
jgi:hypothetical protein